LERDPQEVEAWHPRADATLLHRVAVVADDRHRDEGVIGSVTGGPDDVRNVEHRSVGKQRTPVLHPDGLRVVALDADPVQVPEADADERAATLADLRTHLSPHRRPHRQDVPEHELHDRPAKHGAFPICDLERQLAM
jgi:hypothetical protein